MTKRKAMITLLAAVVAMSGCVGNITAGNPEPQVVATQEVVKVPERNAAMKMAVLNPNKGDLLKEAGVKRVGKAALLGETMIPVRVSSNREIMLPVNVKAESIFTVSAVTVNEPVEETMESIFTVSAVTVNEANPSATAPAVTEAPVAETTVPETTVPETTVPETTAAEAMIPETTVPETTAVETTIAETTAAETTAAETTAAATEAQTAPAPSVPAPLYPTWNYVGRLYVHDHSVALYKSSAAANAVTIVDADDAALYFYPAEEPEGVRQRTIGDHKGQGFSTIWNCFVGDTSYIVFADGRVQHYSCVRVSHEGVNINEPVDHMGPSSTELVGEYLVDLVMYTCNPNSSGESITMTFWNAVD